jgi:hypothetical protein
MREATITHNLQHVGNNDNTSSVASSTQTIPHNELESNYQKQKQKRGQAKIKLISKQQLFSLSPLTCYYLFDWIDFSHFFTI